MNRAAKYLRLLGIVLALWAQLPMQAQISIFPSMAGEGLLNQVRQAYKPNNVLDYSYARDIMYSKIYNENDSVRCVYSGHTLFLPSGVDPSSYLWFDGDPDGINAEHTYPRSKGADEDNGNAYSDMHHLFPARAAVNTSRSNFPFGEINDNQTTTWHYLNQDQGNIPTGDIDLFSERINGKFEPQEKHKGNVARSVFYFFTMYKEEAIEADPNFFEIQRQSLCNWHNQDPVDDLEWDRTYMIANYQNNLPNPFIIDPTLVDRTYCGVIPTSQYAPTAATIKIYPNPVQDKLQVTAQGKGKIVVLNLFGMVLIEEIFVDSKEIDLSFLPSGQYFIQINGQVNRLVKL